MGLPGRDVTLVLVDRAGEVQGQLPPFPVGTPWWQDLEPVLAAHPSVTILRLLDATPDPHHFMGGQARYLAEVERVPPEAIPVAADDALQAALADQPRRMPWARPGGPAADLAWAASQVPITGRPQQIRSWNLSSIWRLPTADGDRWLKCVPPFFAHEPAVLRWLSGRPTAPRLLASDQHRMLLDALPGRDGYDATADERKAIVDALVQVQADAATGLDELAGAVPDWRADPLRAMAAAAIERRRPGSAALQQLLAGWDERLAAVAGCGLPDTLFHGDAHAGNARIGCEPVVLFDWGDSGLGHPLLDLAVLDPADDPDAAAVEAHWLARWRAAAPGSDPDRAWSLLRPVALLRGAVVMQRFLDHIEPSEQVYHHLDVDPFLTKAEAALAPHPTG